MIWDRISSIFYHDILSLYKDSIDSYFFSVGESYYSKELDIDTSIDNLSNIDTMNIAGNILFNALDIKRYTNDYLFLNIIEKLKSSINLTSATVINPHMAKDIKNISQT